MVPYRGRGPAGQKKTPPRCAGSGTLPVTYGYESVGRVIDAGKASGYRNGALAFCRYRLRDYRTTTRAIPSSSLEFPDSTRQRLASSATTPTWC